VNEREKKDLAKGKKRGQRGENVTHLDFGPLSWKALLEIEVPTTCEGVDDALGSAAAAQLF
jgi:hypothetical protein